MSSDMSTGSPRTAADRVLSVLGAFGRHNTELSLTEISRRADLTLTTTHRLVGELTKWGALERDEASQYRIGSRVLELASLSPGGLQFRELALPHLINLHHYTNTPVHLSVRKGLELMYVESLRTRMAHVSTNRMGGRMPLHATSPGLVLLAYADPQVQDEIFAAPLKAFTEQTRTDPEELRRVLPDIRREGAALTRHQVTLGSAGIAAPIFAPDRTVTAAVGTVVSLEHTEPHVVLPAVVTTARQISAALTKISKTTDGHHSLGNPLPSRRDG